MKSQIVMAGLLACSLALPLVGCGGNNATTATSGSAAASTSAKSFDAVDAYWGQWRGSVEITGQTVYGTAGGTEQMLDIQLNKDGSCEVTPLEKHKDLLTDKGTWEGTESEITLKLDSGKEIKLKVADKSKLEGDAKDFDIADFDTINFDFYG